MLRFLVHVELVNAVGLTRFVLELRPKGLSSTLTIRTAVGARSSHHSHLKERERGKALSRMNNCWYFSRKGFNYPNLKKQNHQPWGVNSKTRKQTSVDSACLMFTLSTHFTHIMTLWYQFRKKNLKQLIKKSRRTQQNKIKCHSLFFLPISCSPSCAIACESTKWCAVPRIRE